MNQDIRAPYYARPGAAEPLARLGAAGAVDVGVAAAEVQAGGVAVRGREEGARPGRQLGAGGADRAAQPDHGQSDRGQHLRHQPQHRRRLSMREGPARRARTHRHSAAALRLVVQGEARHLHDGRRRPHRHAAGRRAADAVLVLARPRQRERRDRLLDRLPRHSVRAASRRRCSSSPIRGGLRDGHPQRPVADADSRARGAGAGQRRQGRSRSPRA